MSEMRDVQIHGDGNAVGDNNRILIDKRTYNKIIHRPTGGNGGRGGNKSGGGDGSWIIAVPLAFLVAVAIATWKFALYANAIFMTITLVALLIVGAQILALVVGTLRNVATTWIIERLAAIAFTALLLLAVYWSRSAYPSDVSALAAQAAGWKDFMCGLSTYGHQVATLHMVGICFAAVPCAILLGTNTVGALAGSLFFSTGWLWPGRIAIQLGVRWILVIGSVFAIAAFASQTSVASNFWREAILTKDRDPFSIDGKGFSFCRQVR
jgi:hypothetical protein